MMNKNRNPEVQRGDRVFDELDKNKVKNYSLTFSENGHFFYFQDGFLDSKELSAAMDASKAYLITKSKRVDKNRDGKLDRQEYRDFVSGAYKRKQREKTIIYMSMQNAQQKLILFEKNIRVIRYEDYIVIITFL